MRKKKGVALPVAVAMCSMLLIVSFAVAGMIISITTINKVTRSKEALLLDYLEAYNYFVEHDGVMGEYSQENTRYVVVPLIETNIKALVGYRLNEDIVKFYAVYDFGKDKDNLLAYQTEDFYIPIHDGNEWFGGIVPKPRS